MKRLEVIQARIEHIKEEGAASVVMEIEARLSQLKTQNPKEFSRLSAKLLDIAKEGP